MEAILTALSLAIAVALVGAAAKRVPLPLPLLLVIAGVALAFAPGFDSIRLDPAVFFLLFIPPLLYADGWLISKRDLFAAVRPVMLLAFGLVVFTVVGVGYLVHWLVPSIPLAAAFVLGAIVSPTDAVAVSAVTQRLPLPRRIAHIIEGESLINDASGLVAFKFAIAAVATGGFSIAEAGGSFVLLSVGGTLVGLAIAAAIGWLRNWLARIAASEPSIQTVLSLLTPFAAYMVAEHFHLSGVLAVVAAGLYGGVHDAKHLDPATRLHAWEVWTLVMFIFNGLVFLLLGLELPRVLAALASYGWVELATDALFVCFAALLLRMVWVYPAAFLPRLLPAIREREARPSMGGVFVVGWAGLRGAVTLAASLSIPLTIPSATLGETPFPARDLIIFMASSVIVFTLVVQGLTLPWFIRAFGLREGGVAEKEERMARATAVRAALARLEKYQQSDRAELEQRIAARLAVDYMHRLDAARAHAQENTVDYADAERRIRRDTMAAERTAIAGLRDTGAIGDEAFWTLQRELDHLEATMVEASEAG